MQNAAPAKKEKRKKGKDTRESRIAIILTHYNQNEIDHTALIHLP